MIAAVPNPDACAPAFVTEALFPIAVTALVLCVVFTAFVAVVTFKGRIPGWWLAGAIVCTAFAGCLLGLATLTC